MFTRKSGILALFVGALVLGACDDDAPIVTPPAPATIAIAPQTVPPINVGSTFQLVAVTQNMPAGSTVQWASLTPAVATVNATSGLVTCVTEGSATITATISGTTPVVQNAVAVSCVEEDGGVIGTPTISISRITTPAGTDVNPGAVAGVVNVITNVDIPQGVAASAMRVTVNGVEVCRTSFASGTGADAAAAVPVTVVCSFNTAQLNAQGVPLFPNGPQQIRAEILGPTGTVIANSTSQQLVFANVSALLLTVTSAANAQDAAGLRWEGGNLTVVVQPSIFTANTALQSISVTVTGLDTLGVTRNVTKTVSTTGVAPVTVVFRADSSSAGLGLSGLEDANVVVSATAVTSAGQNFPTAGNFAAPAIRYDAAAPRLTGVVPTYNLATHPLSGEQFLLVGSTFPSSCSLAAPSIYNCGTAGTSAVAATGIVEAGVDVVKMEFQTSPFPLASSPVWTTRTDIASIGQALADGLQARLRVCDNLNNCKNVASANFSASFGVDLVAPFINAVTNVSGVQAGPTVPVAVAAIDTGAFSAGFNTVTGYVQVQVVKDSASSSGANVSRCVSVATGTSAAHTAVPSGGCAFNTVANATGSFTIDPAISGNGYYTVTIRAVDIAGNMTTTTQRFFLIDVAGASILPVVSNVTVTYTTGAATANASATIHDNVDLAEYNSRIRFNAVIVGAANSLPFTAPTIHKAFGVPVSGNAAPAVAVPVIKGVQNGFGGAIIGAIDGIGFSAFDQAGNYGEGYASFSTTAPAAVTNTDVLSSAVAVADDPLCKSSGCTSDPTSTTASAQVVMNVTATPNPLAQVIFYRLDAAGRAVFVSQHAGSGNLTIPSSGPNANLRVFTYTSASISAANLLLGGNTIFAVGVDADGDAVLLGQVVLTTI